MSLQGSLDTFALPDVLVLLASTKKDGELRVVGGRTDGKVFVDKGHIVQTVIGGKDVSPVDGVFELLRLTAGTFSFDGEQSAPKPREAAPLDHVMADAQARLAEWREIEKVVPHLDAVIDMAAEAPDDEVIVSAPHWTLLVAVAGGRSVHDLMARLGSTEFDTCKQVKALVDARLATVDASAPAKPVRTPVSEPTPPRASEPAAVKAESAAPRVPASAGERAERPSSEPEPAREPVAVKSAAGEPRMTEEHIDDLVNRPRKVRASTSDGAPDGPPAGPAVGRVPEAPRVKTAAVKLDDKDEKEEKAAPVGDEAHNLVSQLAALAGVEEDKVAETVAAHLAEGGELPEGADGDEPINRGLLLKFLSSVRN